MKLPTRASPASVQLPAAPQVSVCRDRQVNSQGQSLVQGPGRHQQALQQAPGLGPITLRFGGDTSWKPCSRKHSPEANAPAKGAAVPFMVWW
ncbi:hypothetical protein MRX96_015772 [Rhipicephalus microplus]